MVVKKSNAFIVTSISMVINIDGATFKRMHIGYVKEEPIVVFSELFNKYYIQNFEGENIFPMSYVSFKYALQIETDYVDLSKLVFDLDTFMKYKAEELSYCATGTDYNFDNEYTERLKICQMGELSKLITSAANFNEMISKADIACDNLTSFEGSSIRANAIIYCKDIISRLITSDAWEKCIIARCLDKILSTIKYIN